MNRHWIVLLAAFFWYISCQFISGRLRERTPEGHDYPTFWSWVLRWLAPIGAIIIMGTDLTLTALTGNH